MGSATSRSFAANGPDLLDLPTDLREAILIKVEARQGFQKAVEMRLLSKAWRSAFDSYQGRSACMIVQARGSDRVREVCSILSQMHSLHLVATEVATDFSPLSSLRQLTSLSLSHTWDSRWMPAHEPSLSACMLPVSLRRLDLCPVTMRDIEQLHLPNLTWLSLEVQFLPRAMELPPQLPHLKEFCVKNAPRVESAPPYPNRHLEEVFAGPLESLHAVTKLTLSHGLLLGRSLVFDWHASPAFDWQGPPALQELCLSSMTVASNYLDLLSKELPCITAFSLNRCDIMWRGAREETELDQKVMKRLRLLKLFQSSRGFLRVASEDLSELHLAGKPPTESYFPGDKSLELNTSLQRFTSLTRLVIDACEPGLRLPRQTLAPIAELFVVDSINPESIISEADALASLQSVHVEAQAGSVFGSYEFPYEYGYQYEYQDDSEERKSELQRAATALLSLPQLGQISGSCRLLDEYLAKHLSSWKRCLVSSRVLNVPRRKGVQNFWMWTKT